MIIATIPDRNSTITTEFKMLETHKSIHLLLQRLQEAITGTDEKPGTQTFSAGSIAISR